MMEQRNKVTGIAVDTDVARITIRGVPDQPSRRGLPAPKRGGRRPGAGGKPGNLNALKHGRRSAQGVHPERSLRAYLGLILATIPETRQALLHLAARHRLKQRKAEQIAVLLLNKMMESARPMAERQTINRNEAADPVPQIRRATEKTKPHAKPSNRRHNRRRTIKNQTRNSP